MAGRSGTSTRAPSWSIPAADTAVAALVLGPAPAGPVGCVPEVPRTAGRDRAARHDAPLGAALGLASGDDRRPAFPFALMVLAISASAGAALARLAVAAPAAAAQIAAAKAGLERHGQAAFGPAGVALWKTSQ
jgi:hypothetical protein